MDLNIPVAGTTNFAALRAGDQPDRFDPYPTYHRLRTRAPVWHSPWGDWYRSSFSAVANAATHPACRRSPADGGNEGAGGVVSLSEPISRFLRGWLLFADPPTHTRLRKDMFGLFQAMDPRALEPAIAETCIAFLAEQNGDRADFVQLVAAPLPAAVIVRLLGIPLSDAGRMVAWARALRRLLDSGPGGSVAEAAATVAEMGDYFLALLGDEVWRKCPAAAGLGGLIANYPAEAVAANLAMLAFAGHETTVHLIGSLFLHLGLRPALWQRLRAAPELVPAAVTEALRFESPVQKICRWTDGPIAFDGVTVPDAQLLVLLIGAANRDPAVFQEPDVFDIDRPPGIQLGFGRGAHLCLGRSLALLEAEVVLRVLLERWGEIGVADGGSEWLNNSSFRGLRRLDLRWHSSTRLG